MLHEIRVSGTVLSPLLMRKNHGSGNCVSDFRVSGGPPVVSNNFYFLIFNGIYFVSKIVLTYGEKKKI